jgi:hypothetical protein
MEETAPQRYGLLEAPPNKALVFLPWKRKGDNEATAGDTPQSRNKKHYIHFPSRFFNFQFSVFPDLPPLPTFHRSHPQRINPQQKPQKRPYLRPKSCSGQLCHPRQNNVLNAKYEPYLVQCHMIKTTSNNFLQKNGCFLVC